MTAVLDSGALIAVDQRDRNVGAMLKLLQRDGVPVRTSAGAVAKTWRNGRMQVNLARVLPGVDIVVIDDPTSRRIGGLLGVSGTDGPVDAHVALLVDPQGSVLTSDETAISALLHTRQVQATVLQV